MLKREQELLIHVLVRAWGSCPNLRLGQLIANAQTTSSTTFDLFDVPDAELRKNILNFSDRYGGS